MLQQNLQLCTICDDIRAKKAEIRNDNMVIYRLIMHNFRYSCVIFDPNIQILCTMR